MDWVVQAASEVAVRMLASLFGDEVDAAPTRSFPLVPFQEAAVGRARRILDRRGGVIVADAVGLGKTFIGLALAEEELARGGDVLVAVPASLRPAWRGPLARLSVRYGDSSVHILSHAQLSRGSYPSGLSHGLGMVVVDEAHRFRNAGTRRYAALTELCAGARVVLLTATPVNNGPGDLHALLRIFARDDAFLDAGVPSLRAILESGREASSGNGSEVAGPPPLSRLLEEVVVRRTREMVQGEADPGVRGAGPGSTPLRFPRRAPVSIVRYDDARIATLARATAGLELSPYQLPTGGQGGGVTPANTVALVRLGLLKRLESGAPAIRRSVDRQSGFLRSFLEALDAGRLLRPHLRWPSGQRPAEDHDPLQLLLVDLVAEPWPPGLDAPATRAAVIRDLARLDAMAAPLAGPDPKLDALVRTVAALAPEKVVVFTEFRDTAVAIWRALAGVVPVGRIDGGGAWLGARPAGRSVVVERFAPRANGTTAPRPRERVDVLVATDVLAEGVNLQDARHVISYDLPWNPVRLMQRFGRVDRLGSPHEVVASHLFLPAAGLEDMLGLIRTLRNKLGTIAGTMGGGDAMELLERLGREGENRDGYAASRALARIEDRDIEPLERLRARWHRLPAHERPGEDPARALFATPAAGATTATVPVGVVPAPLGCPDLAASGVVVLVLDRDQPRLVEVTDTSPAGRARDAGPLAACLVNAALDTKPTQSNDAGACDPPPAIRQRARDAVDAALDYVRTIHALAASPPPVPATDPTARTARAIRAWLDSPAAWGRPAAISRADRLLRRLASPHPHRVAVAAERLSAQLDGSNVPESVLSDIEVLLDRCSVSRSTAPRNSCSATVLDPASRTTEPTILAVLMTAPATP